MADARPQVIARPRRRRAPRGAGEQLRGEIVNAASDLLIHTGCPKAVSIRAVAERVGVTSPSIYLHFAGKEALLDAVCAQYFQNLDEEMQSAAKTSATTMDVLHDLGRAYVRFALKNPALYRIATMGEPRPLSDVDTVLSTSVLVHLRTVVQAMVDDGVYPLRDADKMTLELWAVLHGVAALFIAKPYWPLDDVEKLTDTILRAMCCGQIAAGIVGYETPPDDAVRVLMRLKRPN